MQENYKICCRLLAAILCVMILAGCSPAGISTGETEMPSTSNVPSSVPPVSEPPVSEPPVSEPPVSEPPVSEPPVQEPDPSLTAQEDIFLWDFATQSAALNATIDSGSGSCITANRLTVTAGSLSAGVWSKGILALAEPAHLLYSNAWSITWTTSLKKEQIILSGSGSQITANDPYLQTSEKGVFLGVGENNYGVQTSAITAKYPGFSTTAEAAFTLRNEISNGENCIVLYVDGIYIAPMRTHYKNGQLQSAAKNFWNGKHITFRFVGCVGQEVQSLSRLTISENAHVISSAHTYGNDNIVCKNCKTSILDGKKVSVLGDSISTFKNISNSTAYRADLSGQQPYYNRDGKPAIALEDTYWMQFIRYFNMGLCVNNSWAGSFVSKDHEGNLNSSGICRAEKLTEKDGAQPDIIVIFMGVNDSIGKVEDTVFSEAYETLLATVKANYPNAQVFCIGIPKRTQSPSPAKPNAMNSITSAAGENFHYVDLFNYEPLKYPNYSPNSVGDNLHPNESGMELIAKLLISEVAKAYQE